MDWFKENLQETIDFPIKYGVLIFLSLWKWGACCLNMFFFKRSCMGFVCLNGIILHVFHWFLFFNIVFLDDFHTCLPIFYLYIVYIC